MQAETHTKTKLKKNKNDTFIKEIIKNRWLYLLTLPGILFFIVFNYLPIVGIYTAFTDFNPLKGVFGSKFIGLQNFKYFFTSSDIFGVVFNTIFLNVLFITTGLLFQVILAIGLSELGSTTFKKVAQSFMFLPNFISWTVVSIISVALFATNEGIVNNLIAHIGLQPINFFQEPSVWPAILVLLRLWKGAGFGTVIFLATITGIDQEIYEAAKIDGANRLKMIWYITLPLLKTTTVMLLILSVGGIFAGDFGMIFALVGDNPLVRPTTDVIDTFVYRALRLNNDIGMSSAVGLVQSVLGFIMVVTANAITKKIDNDSAIF